LCSELERFAASGEEIFSARRAHDVRIQHRSKQAQGCAFPKGERAVQVKAILITDRQVGIAGYRGAVAEMKVLGTKVIQHIAQQVRRSGIEDIVAVDSLGSDDLLATCADELHRAADAGVDVALIIRTDCYAEVDWDAAISDHLKNLQPVTSLVYGPGPTSLPAVIATPALVVHAEDEIPACKRPYQLGTKEYVNRLRDMIDLRQLANDGLHKLCHLDITGFEVRPGIWLGNNAHIEKGARLVAPVFVGARARIRANAVVTRGSAVEEYALVDCGTVVENATILPFTEIGPGLDVVYCVAGDGKLHSLKRGASVPIEDARLLRERSQNVLARFAGSAAGLLTFLPKQIALGLRGQPEIAGPACNEQTITTTPRSRGTRVLAPGLATLRRYGNE
jgi:carbonic anhydrase/acetyltransferase-like protein (isoleucine patch superfamily)